jgi:hypothetical protein
MIDSMNETATIAAPPVAAPRVAYYTVQLDNPKFTDWDERHFNTYFFANIAFFFWFAAKFLTYNSEVVLVKVYDDRKRNSDVIRQFREHNFAELKKRK